MPKITRTNPEGISKPFSNYSHLGVEIVGRQHLAVHVRSDLAGAEYELPPTSSRPVPSDAG